MNASLLPDLIQSMISWYLWNNKISLLNKQYHEVFECVDNYDNLDDDNCHDPDDDILFLKNYSRHRGHYNYYNRVFTCNENCEDPQKSAFVCMFNYRKLNDIIRNLPCYMSIYSWKFDVKANKDRQL